MNQTFDNAKQVIIEVHEKLQRRSVAGKFFWALTRAQKLEALTGDLRRAHLYLQDINTILAIITIIEKTTGRTIRHSSGKLDAFIRAF